jgi:MFS family permease
VFGAFTTVSAAGQAIGMVAAGPLGDRLGVLTMLNIQGCLYLVAAAVGALGLARTVAAGRNDLRAAGRV